MSAYSRIKLPLKWFSGVISVAVCITSLNMHVMCQICWQSVEICDIYDWYT